MMTVHKIGARRRVVPHELAGGRGEARRKGGRRDRPVVAARRPRSAPSSSGRGRMPPARPCHEAEQSAEHDEREWSASRIEHEGEARAGRGAAGSRVGLRHVGGAHHGLDDDRRADRDMGMEM
jgi:hypothetical protein